MELKDLNQAQAKAVSHGDGPALVVAGAGTGKTQVITRRVAQLIESGRAQASQILAVTFTDKAAAEMEERLDVMLPYGVTETKVMTFHSFGDEILNRYGIEIGLDGRLRLLNQTQQLLFLKQRLDDLELDYFAPISNPVAMLSDLASYFGRLKEELVEPKAYLEWAAQQSALASNEVDQLEARKHQELARAYEKYQTMMRLEGMIDFSDQVTLALELLQQRPNLLAELRKEILYIMVDEFQDTNLAQAKLIELVAGPAGNIMVVGDDDQSIYRFRGAAISNILGFKQRYPNAKEIVLTKNYRSSQAILDAAYRLIQNNNPYRLEAEHKIDKRLVGSARGKAPQVEVYASLAEEARELAYSIKKRIDSGAKPSSIAILVRKKSQAEVVLGALERAEVAYQYGGQERLFDQGIIRLMLSFLQYLVDPTDSISLYSLLSGPIYKADTVELAKLNSAARSHNQSLDGEIRSSAHDLLGNLQAMDLWRTKASELTVGEVLYGYIKEVGYLKQLTDQSESNPEIALEVHALAKFFGLLEEFQRVSKDRSVGGYVSSLGLLEGEVDAAREPDIDSQDNCVQVMTIHRSKGLEFDTVYLFDMTAGAFPARRRAENLNIPDELLEATEKGEGDWHLAEERRLMYVAITRAKANLIASYSTFHGGVRGKKPSVFLDEAFGHIPEAKSVLGKSPIEQIDLFGALSQRTATTHKVPFIRNGWLELTVHQVDDYLSCPLNFYWKHVLNVPQPTQPIMLYGTAIHATISYYYKQRPRRKVTAAELIKYFDSIWEVEGYASRGQEERRRQKGHETIQRFYDREETLKRWPSSSELAFNFELPGNLRVRGRYDAVYIDDDEVEIRDFKTSQVDDSDKAAEKASASRQLALYAVGWYKNHHQIPAKLTLDYIETGKIGEATKSQLELDELATAVTKAGENILAGNFPPGKSHFHCIHDKL